VRRAVAEGHNVSVLNRGQTRSNAIESRAIPSSVTQIAADVRDEVAYREAVGVQEFDTVVNFTAFEPADVQRDINVFSGRVGQYILVSTASVYQTPPTTLPLTESTPLRNNLWSYGALKIACEEVLRDAYRTQDFPGLVVRPSHTYDRARPPVEGGWSVIDRMRRGQEVIVHGDGTSRWPLTHHTHFAIGLVGLIGQSNLEGDSVHIVTDESLTWDRIYSTLAEAAGVEARLVHVPSEVIAAQETAHLQGHASFWGDILVGGKSHSLIFDNSKIKRLVPDFAPSRVLFEDGAREMIEWHDADPSRRVIDPAFNELVDRVITAYRPRRV
jgi:nucleoside-diphosphate-sugar epimerase